VIKLEQQFQVFRVSLPGLRDVQQLQLPVHDKLAAVRDIQEHLVNTAPGPGFRDGRGDRRPLRGAERLGDLPDLIAAIFQRRHLRLHVHELPVTDARHQGRQRHVRQFCRGE
jgi:hypothetical protein